MWRMLQQPEPDDYVVATGESHSILEFVEAAFGAADLDWQKYVVTDEALFRPAEVNELLGDATKARQVLKSEPKITFNELVDIMVAADLAQLDAMTGNRAFHLTM
jgi:GDPmannose 4,6-dehydratase